ncbi:hypothetical protein ABEF92_003065 [Exophiala dermatitidis]|uniref:HIT-type domain-containing protein n=1 Tax=Exophiala dermatitidis (strain ATCC 34100 / CBS 525.76 / NIH/UT8656) TaxID=858893 RepID=H6C2Z6_EXODN|nr:uncharacterized protein HMPREF1120_06029 [Exophiala dermatitidis NIH/UT8656]EHY58011.1 hypothetical protein HMPREF1120_06029 [Exophiala dermatitidis NIH/UT8656]
MPLIEELPVASTTGRPSHGWAYVPADGSNNPLPAAPLGSRKRGRDALGTATATASLSVSARNKLSAKQEKAIQQRLNDLGKENYRDGAHIPVPKRDGGNRTKTTSNVRRILAYSRTFQHYLADEEAGVNVYGSAGIGIGLPADGGAPGSARASQQQRKSTPTVTPTTESKRRGGATLTSAAAEREKDKPTPRGGRPSTLRRQQAAAAKEANASPVKKEDDTKDSVDVEMVDAPAPTLSEKQELPSSSTTGDHSQPQPQPPQEVLSVASAAAETEPSTYDPALDCDPLLRTRDVPKMPSERVMQALLAEPPLSYTAARAKPLEDGGGSAGSGLLLPKPPRWFCAICGYWGKSRCKYGCGERVCGLLECWRAHEGVCPLNAY